MAISVMLPVLALPPVVSMSIIAYTFKEKEV
jgi:hypothetical protein